MSIHVTEFESEIFRQCDVIFIGVITDLLKPRNPHIIFFQALLWFLIGIVDSNNPKSTNHLHFQILENVKLDPFGNMLKYNEEEEEIIARFKQ